MLGWLIVGCLAGWIAGLLTEGRGFGFWKNMGVGIVGAIVGGFACQLLGIHQHGLAAELFVAVVGAVGFLFALEWLRRRREGEPPWPPGDDPSSFYY